VADLNERVQQAERRLTTLKEQTLAAERERVDPADVRAALASFAPVWEQLGPKEQARVVQLLVERVDYDGSAGTVAVTFRPTGIQALARENRHEVAA
jgi:site-specific DNA recombinase